MDQHPHRSRSSSRSELLNPPASIPDPQKAHNSSLSSAAAYTPPPPSPPFASASVSASAHPSSSPSSHKHSALSSTPQSNEANALSPPHYITSSPSTPRRPSSSVLSSPFLVLSSPVLPTLTTMSSQVLIPLPAPQSPPFHDQVRPSSRSERLLRETLRRDRAASLSPRSRMRRPESRSGRVASTSGEMFHCACTDSDDEGDQAHDAPLHVSLLFANLPEHQQKRPLPLQRAAKSSADVQFLSRRDLREKEPIPPLVKLSSSHRRSVPQTRPEIYLHGGAPILQAHDHRRDHDSTRSSPESSSLPSPTSSHRQPLTPSPSPSPPSYAALPETPSRMANTRKYARDHTHRPTTVPLPLNSHQPLHPHSHGHGQPATPPPTPPAFDARGAAAKLRTIDGYVSFANVEGLGAPPGVDEDATEEDKRRGSWWPWRGHSRSGSLTAT